MRVTFLGTSHGVPEPGRKCSATLLEVGSKKYIIDAGADITSELINRGIDPELINAVFITHLHGDHTNGLIQFVGLLSWFFTKADPEIFLPRLEAKEGMAAWLKVNQGEIRPSLRFTEEKEGVIFDDGTIRVTAMRTGHIDISYAFMIEAEGKKVLFTGDMKNGDGPTADYARFVTEDGIDLVVAECAHFDANLYIEPLRKHPPKRFCFNHYSWQFVESCNHVRNTLWGEIPVTLVTDGYEVEL